jgi:hypothetical protein
MKLSILHNSGSKLRWLLSETLVVILGVLIALGLNDYWTLRQEKILELEYLTRIQEDIGADIELIDQFGKRLLERKFKALDAIAPIVRGKAPVPEDVETFLRNVSLGALGGASPTNWTNSTTFEDLKSTGNLRLIRNANLRRKISQYYEEFDEFHTRARDRKTEYAKTVWSVMPAELREDMNLAVLEEFGIDSAIELFTSTRFQNLLNQEYNYAYFNLNIDSSSAKELARELEDYVQRAGDGSRLTQ